ncbi:MAG: hypothetical protein C5S47_02375 [Candidatus Methanogasteraceae archaeon]|nr:MAG: hypothetical protein C5S47_02375 [ANME-2 cluster archaeon]
MHDLFWSFSTRPEKIKRSPLATPLLTAVMHPWTATPQTGDLNGDHPRHPRGRRGSRLSLLMLVHFSSQPPAVGSCVADFDAAIDLSRFRSPHVKYRLQQADTAQLWNMAGVVNHHYRCRSTPPHTKAISFIVSTSNLFSTLCVALRTLR